MLTVKLMRPLTLSVGLRRIRLNVSTSALQNRVIQRHHALSRRAIQRHHALSRRVITT